MHKDKGAGRSDWQTPGWVLDGVRAVIGGPIGLDPASSPDNPTEAKIFYTPAQNGLNMPWAADHIFLNPPWSRKEGVDVRLWLKRAQEVRTQSTGLRQGRLEMFICISAAMNAKWFHEYLSDMDMFFFPKGRIAYQDPNPLEEASAPGFDSVLCYYGTKVYKFKTVFGHMGMVMVNVTGPGPRS